MIVAAAAAMGIGVFLTVLGPRRPALADRVAVYLRPPLPRRRDEPPPARPLAAAGLDWTRRQARSRRAGAAAVGGFVGLLAAQGDLFTPAGRSLPGLVALGGLAGLLGFNMWVTSRRERRAERLRQELPTIADALALRVLAGESVAGAIESLAAASTGVAAEELAVAAREHRAGRGLPEALIGAARTTAHPDAARLYQMLGNAHQTGGRLAEALAELAVDYRAAIARELTAEGGRRAIATYGPILALMIPVALVFLIYPTLVGLRELSGGP